MRAGIFALGAALVVAGSLGAQAGTLDDVKQRGSVVCGVAPNNPGFSFASADGENRGFDVDFCKALGAAIFGDPAKVTLKVVQPRDAFTTLTTGGVDVLTHRFSWTFNRDNGGGIEFTQPVFFDGQAFMVRKADGIKSVKELDGGTICAAQGTTTELNVADYFREHGLTYKIATFDGTDATRLAYDEGRCDAWTNDRGSLASRGQGLKNPTDHIILPENISKEAISPIVRDNDPQWSHLVKWVVFSTIAAEERGINSANVDEIRAASTDPEIKRLLGVGDDLGQKIGLSPEWAYNVIKQVGNYGEIFERNLGTETPLGLERGLNALWTNGGVMMAPPFR
ncbi:amino acid ABC transporter substrate-binding protein [Mesorhizobium sp. KR1-2]|uniref:amino acid ABC transporter substrate-binding protein n=1 Tax=Mesorhizobium sp. KR1-2 TaxID=3156609 RepID=UPI0032B4143C